MPRPAPLFPCKTKNKLDEANRVVKLLDILGIVNFAQWDVLAFIYSHGTNIASAEYIARLLGYTKAAVGAALDSLTAAGLVQRSRNSNGVRIYKFARLPDEMRQRSLDELLEIAHGREGRLMLIKHLRRDITGKTPQRRGPLHPGTGEA